MGSNTLKSIELQIQIHVNSQIQILLNDNVFKYKYFGMYLITNTIRKNRCKFSKYKYDPPGLWLLHLTTFSIPRPRLKLTKQ